jgi:hypothetical protein
MRQLAALALALLALLALAPACQADDPGEPMVDDRPRGERCDEMQACGRAECRVEIEAVRSCSFAEDNCGFDPSRMGPLQTALASCLEDNDCNTTTCDLSEVFTHDDQDAAMYCDSDEDAELVTLGRTAMFVDLTDPAVAECQALE